MDRCEIYMWLEGKARYSLVTKKEMEIVTCCQVSQLVLVSTLQMSCQYDKRMNSKAILIENIEGEILPMWCWKFERVRDELNSVMNWERVNIQFCDSSGGLRDMMDVMEERERCGESESSQKVQHMIVALREIADKAWELVNSKNKQLNDGEWMGWNQ